MEHTEVLAVNRVDRPSQVVNLNLFFSFLFFLVIGLWGALRFFGHDASEDEYLIKNSILVFAAFLLLPFSLWTLVYRKDWFGVVALAPSIFIMPAFFVSAINQNYDPYTGISGLIFVPLVMCGVAISVIFFFRRFENKIFWTIAGLAISVLVVLDLVVLFFWLTRSILLLLTISLPVYLLYKAFRDNAEVLSLLSPGKLLSATLKTLALWSPLSIFIIAGLLMGNFINDLALRINEHAFNSAEQVTESALAFEDCSWYDLVCKKTESIKQQVRQSLETSKQRFNAKELVVQILSHLALLSNVIFIFLAVKSFFYVFARVGVSKKYGLHATLAKQYRVSSQSLASNINLVGQEYTTPPLNTEIFYVVRTLEASGCPPMIKVPQWSCGRCS
ncbi:hypothetical protein [Thiocapsa rosea]|uniref:Uncharacterized protein n=1 Tax=Thiocapsa rosea TaxID=69360 RepID=A0A495V8H8_9GAMM|nr:hypothetical protein [Thiocapsa rosea]RKT44677.1 hypothetical protein BDD21_2071 [Thiocapsa rosea]